jgi:hypothetical protein
MTGRKRSSGITAAELAAQLADDQEFKAAAAERDRELRARAAKWRDAERPIIEELNLAGVQVESVWDLVNTSEPYPAALPVLLDHLEKGGYPDRVMEGLGRALAVKPAVSYWNRLKTAYLMAVGPEAREGIAVALAASATQAHVDDLIQLLSFEEGGTSRIFFLRPIKELGGERGRRVLEPLTSDPMLGPEAMVLFGRDS